MRLGLKKDEVRLEGYTPEWSEEFDRVKNCIMENARIDGQRIEQIGSTAIIGMEAKPNMKFWSELMTLQILMKGLSAV
jgi:GrpB-like predicted nucleotidyltransferase (UPF0157 family)